MPTGLEQQHGHPGHQPSDAVPADSSGGNTRIATTYSTMSNTARAIWKDGSDHVLAARPTADASEGRPDTCAGSTRKAVHPQLEVLSSC